jgi:Raf kinase inhibitor-like YbhB/YbcL family protein
MIKKYLFWMIIVKILPLYSALQLTSPAFKHNGIIPEKYTCDGDNISPRLQWSGAPEETKSFALIVEDPDAIKKTWVHWIVFNIPATVNFLAENVISGQFTSGSTDFDTQRYGGPCPPSGVHRYNFTLYALDISIDNLQAGVDKKSLLEAMHNHIVDQTTLIGRYERVIANKKHEKI